MLRRLRSVFRRRQPGAAGLSPGQIQLPFIAKFLPDSPVIVDAGAHIGMDSIRMSAFWPRGTVHSFEPVPALYKRLVANTSRIENIWCHPVALGNSNEYVRMIVSSGASDGSSSLLLPKEHLNYHPGVFFNSSIKVKSITLDRWAHDSLIQQIDFLWLDVQGFELNLLRAARRILPTVRAIHAEVSLKEMYHGCPLYAELRQWLADQGFSVEYEALPWPDMGNVLFVRN